MCSGYENPEQICFEQSIQNDKGHTQTLGFLPNSVGTFDSVPEIKLETPKKLKSETYECYSEKFENIKMEIKQEDLEDFPEYVDIGIINTVAEVGAPEQELSIEDNPRDISHQKHERVCCIDSREYSTPHKNFSCHLCNFGCNRRDYFEKHIVLHELPVPVKLFKCSNCRYQSKFKSRLRNHMLVHKDPSQVKMFECTECDFQTRYKGSLRNHLAMHEDPLEVQWLKLEGVKCIDPREDSTLHNFSCHMCKFGCNRKDVFDKHMILHEAPRPTTIFKCTYCSHQTHNKHNLRKHLLVHENPSQVQSFNCIQCNKQFKHKHNLNRHMLLLHKDSSQFQII